MGEGGRGQVAGGDLGPGGEKRRIRCMKTSLRSKKNGRRYVRKERKKFSFCDENIR